jgi:beta-lactamase class D
VPTLAAVSLILLATAIPDEAPRACFLLHEIGVGEIARGPETACRVRVSPQSTFKVPHALAALDARVIAGPDTAFRYDGRPFPVPSWRRDHTLASAMPSSVFWYFQRLAALLGPEREAAYLRRFGYGNQDAAAPATSFWVGGSLLISPEEQMQFLRRLYANDLPVDRAAMAAVRRLLIQPPGSVVNARGQHPFGSPWPKGTVVSAKTGAGDDRSGRQVRWLIGHVSRGRRRWLFVSCVVGDATLSQLAAIELAARSLQAAHVL